MTNWRYAVLLGAALGGLMGCSDAQDDQGKDEAEAEAVGTLNQPASGAAALRIVFGSCADDDAPDHPVWQKMHQANPDAVLMLGDNVYADSAEFSADPTVERMRSEYAKLEASKGFQQLRANRPMYATWDDHDFGLNDGGAEFFFKEQAASVFLDFWDFPPNAPARKRPGVYSEQRILHQGIDVQVLLLDTRTFRGPLKSAGRSLACPLKNYELNNNDTFLGEAQWAWLKQKLRDPADVRLLVSSQQVIPDQHCFEKWGNFPEERKRLFAEIRQAGASNLIILSGDRHLGEISRLAADDAVGTGFDLYEVTSSPMSARSGFGWGETNDYRVNDDNLRESQFGILDIQRLNDSAEQGLAGPNSGAQFLVSMQLHDAEGRKRFDHSVAVTGSVK